MPPKSKSTKRSASRGASWQRQEGAGGDLHHRVHVGNLYQHHFFSWDFLRSPTDWWTARWYNLIIASPGFLNRYLLGQWHRLLFLGTTTLSWLIYEERKHAFISFVYQKDKYGVVINYAVISLLELWYNYLHHTQYVSPATDEFERVLKRRTLELYGVVTFFKVLAVNFIFSNHTEELEAIKARTHLTGVILLGVFSTFDAFIKFGRDGPIEVLYEIGLPLIFAGFFSFLGERARLLRWGNVYLNFFTMIVEAMVIVSTM